MLRNRTARSLALLGAAGSLALVLSGCTSAVEVTIPASLTEPGTALKVGETARLEGSGYQKDPRQIADFEVGVTVVSITKKDASLYDELSNGEEFVDYTPYTVVVQDNLPAELAETYDSPFSASMWGVLDNGEFAEYLDVDGFGSIADLCGDGAGTRNPDVTISCQVFLVPEGAELDHVEWNSETLSGIGAGLNLDEPSPFIENPITWK